jgi:ASPIC and UnbV
LWTSLPRQEPESCTKDIDRDGDEDILTVIGGAVPGDAHAFRLFENPGNSNDWINLKLVGKKTNRAALGSRIKVTVENEGKGERFIFRTVGSGGSFGASPMELHIGLGQAARIISLEIWWPGSKTRQSFSDVKNSQYLEITEFAREYKKLARPAYKLGGGARRVKGTGEATAGSTK